jgi:hypothetical protein
MHGESRELQQVRNCLGATLTIEGIAEDLKLKPDHIGF